MRASTIKGRQMRTEASPTIPGDRNGASVLRRAQPEHDVARLIQRVRDGDSQAAERLRSILIGGIRLLIERWVGSDKVEDLVHRTCTAVVDAVRHGRISDSEGLLPFVRGTASRLARCGRRSCARSVGLEAADRGSEVPAQQAMSLEERWIAQSALRRLSGRQRELLTRFYVASESKEQITTEMRLTDAQYELLKSRAKARFTALVEQGRR